MPRSTAKRPGESPVLSYDYVLAPVAEDSDFDLDAAARSKDPAVLLRRAWVLLQQRRPQDAIDASAQVLYGSDSLAPQTEAFARYVRAAAFAAAGQKGKGDHDRRRALELVMDERLRDRLESLDTGTAPAVARAPAKARETEAVTADVRPRSDWNPTAPIRGRLDPMGTAYRITVHHSAIFLRDGSAQAAASQLRRIQREHMQRPDEPYGDIGYHYLIDPAGRIWQGRELRYQGAHARDDNNRGNIGICILGNFVRGRDGQRPTAEELAALRTLIQSLSQRYGIGGDQIHCHSDFVKTACPGPYLKAEVEKIAREMTVSKPSSRRGPSAE